MFFISFHDLWNISKLNWFQDCWKPCIESKIFVFNRFKTTSIFFSVSSFVEIFSSWIGFKIVENRASKVKVLFSRDLNQCQCFLSVSSYDEIFSSCISVKIIENRASKVKPLFSRDSKQRQIFFQFPVSLKYFQAELVSRLLKTVHRKQNFCF